MSRLTLVSAPSGEPISTATCKTHLRVDGSSDDTLIDSLILASRIHAENYLRRALVTQTWDYFLDAFPNSYRIEIPLAPLASVTSVKYTNTSDSETTLSSSKYRVDTEGTARGQVVLKDSESFPSDETLKTVNAVVVRFVAGYGGTTSTPQPIMQAMYLHVAHMFENREMATDGVMTTLPFAYESLMAPYRNWGL